MTASQSTGEGGNMWTQETDLKDQLYPGEGRALSILASLPIQVFQNEKVEVEVLLKTSD